MLVSILAGTWLIAISGKLAAVRAGSVSSVVHRGAFLFKAKGACPQRNTMARATADCRHDEIRAYPVRRAQETGHAASF
ncbi:hypothetical protein [Cupriavidus lacunae]|uniref:hypothetical protein n=1 Tax=Cupriavidus lacunae TaxID=2666307 RepID=UPI001374A100|nr:hypothetical protein [Cupriavidus lacunae]